MVSYRQAERNFIQWLSITNASKVKKAKKAQQLVQIGALKRLAAEGKEKHAVLWIENFLDESDGKLVVYAHHRRMIEILYKHFSKTAVCIYGNTTAGKKKQHISNFQKSSKIRLFIGSMAAIEGITLTAADTMLFTELWFVPGLHIQAEDRIHRIGQTRPVTIHYMVAKNTIEEKLCQILQNKQCIIEKTLDGQTSGRHSSLNVYEQLIEEILNNANSQRPKRQ